MSNQPLIDLFQDDINRVIQKHCDTGITFGEAIGVLEIVKLDLWHAEKEKDYDPYNNFDPDCR